MEKQSCRFLLVWMLVVCVNFVSTGITKADLSDVSSSATIVSPASIGKYGGYLSSSDGKRVQGNFKSIKISKTGKFSAKMYWGNTSYSVKGVMNASGYYSGVVTSKRGNPASVVLQLMRSSGGAYKIDGSVDIGGASAVVVAVKSGVTSTIAGAYTMIVFREGEETTVPQGYGYGLMKVTSTGAAKIKGLLGDGSKWTAKCYLTADGEMPLYASLYRKAGWIGGLIVFSDVPNISDCRGGMHWYKPAGTGVLPFSQGFDLERDIIGSRYRYTGTRVLAGISDSTPNTEAYLGEVQGDDEQSYDLEWTNANRLIYSGSEKVKISVKTKTGQIKGYATDDGQKWKAEGVVFQKQDLGVGLAYIKGRAPRTLVIAADDEDNSGGSGGNGTVAMATIPAGSFAMGGTEDYTHPGIGPERTVYVSEFLMGKTEITKTHWEEVRAWAITHGYTDLPIGQGDGPSHPVHSVSWQSIVKWCNAKSEREGKTPCYYVSDYVNWSVFRTGTWMHPAGIDYSADGYRLPSEAEWEKAARGGLSGERFPWGNTASKSKANYDSNGTKSVGSYAANNYGLFDMAGNVSEWCNDIYYPYDPTDTTNPVGPDLGSTAASFNRVIRGGDWVFDASSSECVHRSYDGLVFSGLNNVGFRVVLGK